MYVCMYVCMYVLVTALALVTVILTLHVNLVTCNFTYYLNIFCVELRLDLDFLLPMLSSLDESVDMCKSTVPIPRDKVKLV